VSLFHAYGPHQIMHYKVYSEKLQNRTISAYKQANSSEEVVSALPPASQVLK